MNTRKFKVMIENVHIKNENNKIVETGLRYPKPWGDDDTGFPIEESCHKVNVRAYHDKQDSDGVDWCIVEIDEGETEFIDKLLQSLTVEELTTTEAETFILEARPPKSDILITIFNKEKVTTAIEDELKTFLEQRGITYTIR